MCTNFVRVIEIGVSVCHCIMYLSGRVELVDYFVCLKRLTTEFRAFLYGKDQWACQCHPYIENLLTQTSGEQRKPEISI